MTRFLQLEGHCTTMEAAEEWHSGCG